MFVPAVDRRLVFVDVETTGASPARERVTEIGVVCVDFDDDAVRVDEWSHAGQPGVPIPSEIQWLTGITNDMVRAAPSFADIAQPLFDRLEGAIFVAHNARFDYGFVRAEFTAPDLSYNAKTLCTVRLSRYLYPDRAPHTLDAIIERFNLDGEPRHRALGDARVLWRLLQRLADRHPHAEIELAMRALLRRPALPLEPATRRHRSVCRTRRASISSLGLTSIRSTSARASTLRARVAAPLQRRLPRAEREMRLSQEVHRARVGRNRR